MKNEEKKGVGRILARKSGYRKDGKYGGYEYLYLSLPNLITKDSTFPFKDKEEVNVELKDGKLIVAKRDEILDLIEKFDFSKLTLPWLIEEKAKENKTKPFLLFKSEKYSYEQIHTMSNRIAHGILKLKADLKLKKFHIALLLPNSPIFFFCWFGVVKANCVFVPINRFSRGEDLRYLLDISDSEVIILDFSFLKDFQEIQTKLVKIKKVIVVNAPETFKFGDLYMDYQDIVSDTIETPKTRANPGTKMEIIFTEGATGKPKAIVYRNFLILAGLIFNEEIKKYGKGNIVYCPTPLFQAFAQLVVVFPVMFLNATIALAEKFDAKTFWDDVQNYKADLIVYYGAILQILMDMPPSDKDRSHKVKYALGGQAPVGIWEAFENRFGVTIYEGWAPTEAIGFTVNGLGTKGGKVGSIGTPVAGFDIKVVDPEGKEKLPGPDNIGEIIVKRNLTLGNISLTQVLLEYYKSPESTPMTFKEDGYVYTGDLGYKDKDDYLYYVGRKVDRIKRYGKEISANIIENVANGHPSILESAAFGIPGESPKNEDIKICVVLKRNKALTHEELYDYLREKLAFNIVPRYIEFKKSLRKSSERIKKYRLKEEWDLLTVKKNTWDASKQKVVKS